MIEALKLMLRLVRVQEENRLAAMRRARQEVEQVRGVVGQLNGYAREYREQALERAVRGTTPAEQLATAAFEQRLTQTAQTQQLVVGQLEGNVEQVRAQVVAVRMRQQVLEGVLQKKLEAQQEDRIRREAREVEESVAVRQMIRGMNSA